MIRKRQRYEATRYDSTVFLAPEPLSMFGFDRITIDAILGRKKHESSNYYNVLDMLHQVLHLLFSQVQIELNQIGKREFLIKLFYEHKRGGFGKLMDAIHSLGLQVVDANMTTFNGKVLNILKVEVRFTNPLFFSALFLLNYFEHVSSCICFLQGYCEGHSTKEIERVIAEAGRLDNSDIYNVSSGYRN